MALRTILKGDDPALHKKCRPVTEFNRRLWDLIDDLKETLADAEGAGLAAPQIGILRRVAIVVNEEEEMVELINPMVISQEGEDMGYEGCLSVPGQWGEVLRPAKVRIRAQDRNGNEFEMDGEGMTARCFCHEIEHLDGHLFTERSSQLYTTEELDAKLEKEGKTRGKRGRKRR